MSEVKTPMHDKYYGTFKKGEDGKVAHEAGVGLPRHLETTLTDGFEVTATERRTLTREASKNGWDELNIDDMLDRHDAFTDEMGKYRDMLDHPQVPVQDPDAAYSKRFEQRLKAIAAEAVPIPEGTEGKALRELKRRREKVAGMLRLDEAAYRTMDLDWADYERMQLVDERAKIEAAAFKEERTGHPTGPEMRRSRSKMEELDKKHAGRFSRVGQLPHLEIETSSGATAEVDPVTAFNNSWRRVKEQPDYAKILKAVVDNGHDEAWLRRQHAEQFFTDNLASQMTDRYDASVKDRIFRNKAKKVQGLVADDAKMFAIVAAGKDPEANADFIRYAGHQRKYNGLKEGRNHAVRHLLRGAVVSAPELRSHQERRQELHDRLSGNGEPLSEQENAELHDLSLVIEELTAGRAGLGDAGDNERPGARNKDVRSAMSRTLARTRLATRAAQGHSKTMKTMIHSAAVLRSTGDIGWEVTKFGGRQLRRLGRAVLRSDSRAAARAAAPTRPVVGARWTTRGPRT